MPNSVVLLTVHADRIDAELQIPLSELQAAWSQTNSDVPGQQTDWVSSRMRSYLAAHIRPQTLDGKRWSVTVGRLSVQETRNPVNGVYRELTAQILLVPPAGADVRRFTLHYDAVIHQVVTHKILVSVRQDWARGQLTDHSPTQAGVIELDIVNNRVPPLEVSLEAGSAWTGFRAMIELGIRHISEGTDHLLFLLVLLLPAPLLVVGGRWGRSGGVRYSLRRVLLIVTAFTLGHSLTLLLGALQWVWLPAQPVEVLIAVSILVSALHAVRPLFPGRMASGREAWVAAGFGLIHGLAFADTLSNLDLDTGPLLLSILGFNLGIEGMQLVVIALTIPWLILLSRTSAYRTVRLIGALLAAVAALAWVIERVTGQANRLAGCIEQIADHAHYVLIMLAILSLFLTWKTNRTKEFPLS